jgi:hypothetical protein
MKNLFLTLFALVSVNLFSQCENDLINPYFVNFEPEVTIKAIKNRNAIFEVGISYNPRGYAEGKKIKFFDAIKAIYCIFKYSLFKSN